MNPFDPHILWGFCFLLDSFFVFTHASWTSVCRNCGALYVLDFSFHWNLWVKTLSLLQYEEESLYT
jgi:hypothetical protein